jgi:hypothetical protein
VAAEWLCLSDSSILMRVVVLVVLVSLLAAGVVALVLYFCYTHRDSAHFKLPHRYALTLCVRALPVSYMCCVCYHRASSPGDPEDGEVSAILKRVVC